MRIGVLTDAFPPEVGGIQTYADQFVTELANHPLVEQVDVLAFVPGNDETRDGVRIRRVNLNNTPAKLLSGLKWFRHRSVDVVHSLTLYPSGLLGALCKRIDPGVNGFVTVYGLGAISLAPHPILGPIQRFTFGSLDEVIFFSDSTREKTHNVYDLSFQSRRIYPGVPRFKHTPEEIADKVALPAGRFVVLCVARLVKRKGIDDLIDAVAELPGVSLWIVGDGPQRETLERRVPREARDRISFLGEITHNLLPILYHRADVFCMPSVYLEDKGDVEGLGLVFLEAQSFGVPVIGTRSGGIPEALVEGETGFLVDEQAPGQIRDCIGRLHDDEELYATFSDRAKAFVKDQFAWGDCIEHHLDAYQQQ